MTAPTLFLAEFLYGVRLAEQQVTARSTYRSDLSTMDVVALFSQDRECSLLAAASETDQERRYDRNVRLLK